MKAPRERFSRDLLGCAQRPWANGLEDIALFWYGDALAMHQYKCAAPSHVTNMPCMTLSNRRFRPWSMSLHV